MFAVEYAPNAGTPGAGSTVRLQRIDKNLAEADKQSKELEASSPARSTWTVTTGLQLACVVLGVGLLAGVSFRKWKGQ